MFILFSLAAVYLSKTSFLFGNLWGFICLSRTNIYPCRAWTHTCSAWCHVWMWTQSCSLLWHFRQRDSVWTSNTLSHTSGTHIHKQTPTHTKTQTHTGTYSILVTPQWTNQLFFPPFSNMKSCGQKEWVFNWHLVLTCKSMLKLTSPLLFKETCKPA